MNFDGIRNRDPYANQYNQRVQEKRDPNRELISAVEGVKVVAAVALGMVNPLAGLLAYNVDTPETVNDISNINKALKEGAKIDYQEPHNGYTALIHAAWGGYPNIVRHLIQQRANPELKEDKGYNAYTMAKHYLDRYRTSLKDNETRELTKTFTYKNRSDMKDYYEKYIDRYLTIVTFLQPITRDRNMPDKRSCCTIL